MASGFVAFFERQFSTPKAVPTAEDISTQLEADTAVQNQSLVPPSPDSMTDVPTLTTAAPSSTAHEPLQPMKQPQKAPRRSSGSSLLPFFLPLAAVALSRHGAENVGDVQSMHSALSGDASSSSRRRSNSKHQHSPSLNFDDLRFSDPFVDADAILAQATQNQSSSKDDGNAADGSDDRKGSKRDESQFLVDYALFDVLGESDPLVINFFSHTVAAVDSQSTVSSPSAVTDCTGGVYVLGNNDAVFKPRDEEATGLKSKSDQPLHVGDTNPLRQGFRIGDGAIREVAAYHLDRAARHFARVPPTTLASVRSDVMRPNSKQQRFEGSIQKYVTNTGSSEDFGSSCFDLEHIQAIALLDVRLFNTDRHGGNMLVQDCNSSSSGKRGLVPIDHGLCLPAFQHLGEFEVEWLYWREAREPLTPSARAHVADLDAYRDAAILRGLGIHEQSILTMQLMTKFLRFAVLELNWSLHDIGVFLTRSHLSPIPPEGVDNEETTSDFQKLLERAAAASADQSLPGFLRGDDSVPFSMLRASRLLEAAETQWTKELSAK
eukprot:INCI5892.5.p1 GENE.INCI5892.5~~INCI5892.5.p1  ORF type:complete len:548 (+),score=104.11 INCI5892.5:267-1910(+)